MQANLRHLNLAAQTRYYTGLKSVEPNDNTSHRNKSQESKSSNHRRTQTSQSGMKSKINATPKIGKSQKYCEIHGKCNHTTAQCEVIQKQRTEYQNRPSEKNNKNKNNDQPRYNTRSNAKKQGREENNNLSIKNQSDESSSASSELNQIEEIFNINDDNPVNKVCTEVRIQSLGN